MCRHRHRGTAAAQTAALRYRSSTSGCIMSSQKVRSVSQRSADCFPPSPIHMYYRISAIRWRMPSRERWRNVLDDREIGLQPRRTRIRVVCCRSATNSSDWRPSSVHLRAQLPSFRCLRVRKINLRRGFVDWRERHSTRQIRSNCRHLNKSTVSDDNVYDDDDGDNGDDVFYHSHW